MAWLPKASELYASQLVSQGYGHPLWYPEPAQEGEILIGDVGYIHDGRFVRLFNACHSEYDEMNKNGVPEDFVPLQIPGSRDYAEVAKPGDSLCSDSVDRLKAGTSAGLSACVQVA